MWNATAEVDRSAVLQADLGQASAFLRTAGPWALMPGADYAFTVPDSPSGIGRLICLVGPAPDGLAGGILEVVDEAPGQMLRVRSRSTNPVGKQIVTLSARQDRRGVQVRLGLREACQRPAKASVESAWRKTVDAWLRVLAETIDGRRAWPAAEMPAAMQKAWREGSALSEHDTVSVEDVIRAPRYAVWQAVRSPEKQRQLRGAVYGGRVPGTPDQRPGEMIYLVRPHPDNQLAAAISLVADLADQEWVRIRRVGRPRSEILTSLLPDAEGTRITLTCTVPKGSSADVQRRVAADLDSRMTAYHQLLEQPA